MVGLPDADDGARRSAHDGPSRMQIEVLLQARSRSGVGEGPLAAAEDVVGGVADTTEPRGHDRIGAQGAARGIHGHVGARV